MFACGVSGSSQVVEVPLDVGSASPVTPNAPERSVRTHSLAFLMRGDDFCSHLLSELLILCSKVRRMWNRKVMFGKKTTYSLAKRLHQDGYVIDK
jgi:hypothetical protein